MSVNSSNLRFQKETSTPRFQVVVCAATYLAVIHNAETHNESQTTVKITNERPIIFAQQR